MKKQLIEMSQEYLIECDAPACGYKIENETKNAYADISEYINKPCPNCGANLLTEKDYKDSLKILKVISWINKWFSWTLLFVRKPKYVESNMKVHDGVKIKIHEDIKS